MFSERYYKEPYNMLVDITTTNYEHVSAFLSKIDKQLYDKDVAAFYLPDTSYHLLMLADDPKALFVELTRAVYDMMPIPIKITPAEVDFWSYMYKNRVEPIYINQKDTNNLRENINKSAKVKKMISFKEFFKTKKI